MRSFILSGAVLLGSLANMSFALPSANTTIHASGDQWARFCSDDSCNDNCSEWFDLSNSGCFNNNAPGSYEIKGNAYSYHALVLSAGGNCPCQTSCMNSDDDSDRYWSDGCHKLDGEYQSFRFLTEHSCDADNC